MTERKSLTLVNNGDSRIPLPPDTIIKDTSGICYKIKNEEVGLGGSALIYRVERTGSLRNFILKECYPYSKELFFDRKDGVVYGENEESENELRILKENMRRENETEQILSLKNGRIITAFENVNATEIIIEGKSFNASNICFVFMEQATDGKNRGWFLNDLLEECSKPAEVRMPLRNGGLPTPIVATKIIAELLKSLRDIHNAGYIHGDINDANIFLGHDPQNSDIGVGQFIDFGESAESEKLNWLWNLRVNKLKKADPLIQLPLKIQ